MGHAQRGREEVEEGGKVVAEEAEREWLTLFVLNLSAFRKRLIDYALQKQGSVFTDT